MSLVFFFPCLKDIIANLCFFVIIVAVSVIWGRARTWKPSKIDFKISCTDTTIEILFSNLFEQDGLRVIPVNEFFDSEIGTPVSSKSLHGIFIEKHLNGKNFDEIVAPALAHIVSNTEDDKTEGKNKHYPIGTTVKITTDTDYLLFALAKTDPKTCKAFCDVATMWTALEGLLQKARVESGGNPINIPLVGSGQSGVGLPARDLLDLIVLSVVRTTQKEKISPKIRIILQNDRFEELDLRSIKKHWKESIMAYRNGTYVAFHADETNIPGQSDIDYYNLLKAWTAKTDDDFSMTNSHDKASAVRDSSKRATLRASLLTRLRNSKNMILIIGQTTRFDTDWVPFEIQQAIDEYKIPIVALYPDYECILDPKQLRRFWPGALATRIDNGTAHVIHIPFKKAPIADAIDQFDVNNHPKGGGLGRYSREAYQLWGLIK